MTVYPETKLDGAVDQAISRENRRALGEYLPESCLATDCENEAIFVVLCRRHYGKKDRAIGAALKVKR